jgi:hypothetical protein
VHRDEVFNKKHMIQDMLVICSICGVDQHNNKSGGFILKNTIVCPHCSDRSLKYLTEELQEIKHCPSSLNFKNFVINERIVNKLRGMKNAI